MKIVFVSNYFNHHQNAISEELNRMSAGEYFFVATEEMSDERRSLGYGQSADPEYVLYSYKNGAEYKKCQRVINEADMVIAGSAPERLLRKRIKVGKLIFRYAERPLKKGIEPVKYVPRLLRWHARNPMCKPVYMLCASAYTAGDYSKFGLFWNRCYRWGYFPETKHYDLDTLIQRKRKEKISLLWVGRFLAWKHPEYAVQVAQKLKNDGYLFELNMIGTGVMEEEIKAMITALDVEDCVHMLGSMPPEKVRKRMEEANVFLFTSDKQEGWGAVLNESMNSGCAVVACDAIGSVPFLMKDGQNGLIYQQGDFEGFYQQTKRLVSDLQLCEKCGRTAYRTITEMWNSEVAADRLIQLTECLRNGKDTPFADGPCSKAEILKG